MYQLIDEISELVYVVDMENYDLLYVNKTGKKMFGIDDVKNLKCYRAIQGRDSPCEFCTNEKLTKDRFYTWEAFNPVAKRYYILKDKLVPWDNRMAHMQIALDITEQARQKLQLENTLRVERLILDCVKALHGSKDLRETISLILEKVGWFLEADRAYIFQMEGAKMSNTWEWCAKGIQSQQNTLQNLSVELVSRWMERFRLGEGIFIKDVECIREISPEEYETLHRQGIRSLMAVPLEMDGDVAGYIGVDNPAKSSRENLGPILDTIAYFLVSAIEKIDAREALQKISFFDELTGLYNRNRFMRDMEGSGFEGKAGIVDIDINGLKELNSRRGHAYGDEILKIAAGKIQQVFPDEDAYRVGSDEFAVFCPNMPEQEFFNRVQELQNLFFATADCSAALGSKWSDEADLDLMMSQANEQMYQNKKRYYQVHRPTARYRYEVDDLLGLADTDRLRQALREKRFLIYMQPKVRFEDRKLIGAEALVRYLSPEGRIVAPDAFIPAMESARLTKFVDFFVFSSTCKIIQEWLKEGRAVVPVSVNFSRYTLMEPDFIDTLLKRWEQYNVPKKLIELEITESVETVDMDYMYMIMEKIQRAGFAVAIDDFGVKYANLALLKSSDVSTLKLDKSLINELATSRKTQILINSVAQACRDMEIHFIVEGVETEEQFEILRELECYGAQGYLFSKPVPPEKYELILPPMEAALV